MLNCFSNLNLIITVTVWLEKYDNEINYCLIPEAAPPTNSPHAHDNDRNKVSNNTKMLSGYARYGTFP